VVSERLFVRRRKTVNEFLPLQNLVADVPASTAASSSERRVIIDHLAIVQPRTPPAPREPWADLPRRLDLARRRTR
jgi:hypothetical protein